jgi:hypothetical protein
VEEAAVVEKEKRMRVRSKRKRSSAIDRNVLSVNNLRRDRFDWDEENENEFSIRVSTLKRD